MNILKDFVVLFREKDSRPLDDPLGFVCQAEDLDHAEEQCENAYPDCEIVWVVDNCSDCIEALEDYYYRPYFWQPT